MVKRDPTKDNLAHPVPKSGATKSTVNGVLTALKIGNGLIAVLSGLLAAVMILYSSYVLYDTFVTDYQAYSSSWDLLKYKPEVSEAEPSQGKDLLSSVNKDYRAWLTVYDTTIDYPVMQGKDDLYYASHDVYGNASFTGAIYLAADNTWNFSDSYNLIYGHHMDNGAMFGALDAFTDLDYFKSHQEAVLVSESGVYDIEFFAVVSTDAYESQIYSVGNRAKEVIAFLSGSREFDAGIGTTVLVYDEAVAKGAKKVIALSTCADADTNGRLVVFGRMIRRGVEEEEEEPEEVKLTIHYLCGDEEIFPPFVEIYAPGDQYRVISPQYPGYTVDIEVVQGTITEDTIIYVHYVPQKHKLVIDYVYLDGTEASPTYRQEIQTGDVYDIESPVIEGYKATHLRITGQNPGRDEHYTVVYIPIGGPDPEDLMKPKPGYLGPTCIQMGICFE